LLRWRERLEEFRTGWSIDTPVDMARLHDDIVAAFQSAYHLKDWLKNDQGSGVFSVVEASVAASPTLLLAADLCNGTKHLALTPPGGRTEDDPTLGAGHMEANFGGSDSGIRLNSQSIVLDDGTVLDAYDVLDKIIDEWRDLLRGWNLI
jgi:hypothetical protein